MKERKTSYVSGSARARRTANVHHHPVQATVRESLVTSGDPIAELLSQLSGVRRSASSSSSSSSQQLQQLQMQLQLERQRQRGLHQYHSLAGVSSNDHSAAANPHAGMQPGAINNGGIVVSNSIGGVSTSHPMTMGPMGSHLWTNVTSSSKAGASSVSGPAGASATSVAGNVGNSSNNGSNGTFLLSQVSDDDSSDNSLEERKKRELFVEELVLASLANTNLNNHDS